jgi:hypothetical protein
LVLFFKFVGTLYTKCFNDNQQKVSLKGEFMQKTKVLLFTMAIMVIALTFFEDISMAAEVTRIHSSRKYVFINGSIPEGFVMGARVCFFASPDADEPITCGPIDQVSESYARVRVNNRIAKQIRYGMEARLSDEKVNKTETTEPLGCTSDSECGSTGYCVNGRCQQRQEETTEYRACTDDSECGSAGFCFNGRCQKR